MPRFYDFGAGLRADLHPGKLPAGATPDCSNVVFDRRSFRVRPGRTLHTRLPTAAGNYGARALFQFAPAGQDAVLVAVCGDDLVATTTSDQTFVGTEASLAAVPVVVAPPHPVLPVRAEQAGNALYFVDGASPLRKLSAAGAVSSVVSALPAPTMAPTVNAYRPAGASPLWTADTPYLAAGLYEFAFAFDDVEDLSPLGPVTTVSVGQSSTHKQIIVGLPQGLETEGVAAGALYAGLYMRTPYTDSEWRRAIHLTLASIWIPGGVTLYAAAPVPDVSGAARAATVVTASTTTDHNLVVGEYVTVAGVPLGTGGTDFNGSFYVSAVPASNQFRYVQVGIADDTAGTGGTATPYPRQRLVTQAVRAANVVTVTTTGDHGFAVGAGVTLNMPDHLVDVAVLNAAGAGYLSGDVLTLSDGAAGAGATIRIDGVDGGGGITAFTQLTDGQDYTVATCTTAGGAGAGATFDITLQSNSFDGYHVIASVPSATTFTVADTGAAETETLDGSAVLYTDQEVDAADLTVVSDLWNGPPEGATHVLFWNNRLVLVARAAGDTSGPKNCLWISDLGDFEQFRAAPVLDPTDDMGAVIVAGDEDLTGLTLWGSGVLAQNASGRAWRLDGYSPATFRLDQVSDKVGCASQESIAQGPSGPIWLGPGNIWTPAGFAPKTPAVGEPVAPLLKDYTATQREGALGAYNLDTRRYLVVLPTDAGDPDVAPPWPAAYRGGPNNARTPYRTKVLATGALYSGVQGIGRQVVLDEDDAIYVLSKNAADPLYLQRLAYTGTWTLMWSTAIPDYLSATVATMTVTDPAVGPASDVYAADGQYSIVALDKDDGAITWRYTPSGGVERCYWSPTLGPDGRLYFCTYGGATSTVYCLEADGSLAWSTALGAAGRGSGNTTGPLACDGRHLYVPGTNGYLTKLTLAGAIVWSLDVSTGVRLNPPNAADPDYLYIIDSSGFLRKIAKSDGSTTWTQFTGGAFPVFSLFANYAVPALSHDRATLYCGGTNGDVWALNASDASLAWYYQDAANPTRDMYSPVVDFDGAVTCCCANVAARRGFYRLFADGTLNALTDFGVSALAAETGQMVVARQGLMYYCVLGGIWPITTPESWVPKSEALVLDTDKGVWTRYADMPGGALLYAGAFATPALYASDPEGADSTGRVWRLEEGIDDEGWPIAWEWWTSEIEEPAGHYKDVGAVRASGKSADAWNTLLASIRANEADTDDATSDDLNLPAAATTPRQARWRPPLLPDVMTARVGLSGDALDELEITALEVMVADKGKVV